MTEIQKTTWPRLAAWLLAGIGICTAATAAAQERHPNGALAPALTGLGNHSLTVTTQVPQAQAFFDQGLRLLYGFNHPESLRAFKEAARLDPALAMAFWGQAMATAPNLNAPMSEEDGRAAYTAVKTAVAKSQGASVLERNLINALSQRIAADPKAPREALNAAYAAAMARAAAAYPDNADVQVLYADAVMNQTPWSYWQNGIAKPETVPVQAALEKTLAQHPDHPGAHHYYIHLMEASTTPEKAEASADRLATLMPAAGHMVHMPAHIYLRVGRYADAAAANVKAIDADEDYLAQCQAQGLYPFSYYPHNVHFLWLAATLEGRSAVAVDAAQQVANKVPHHHAGSVAWNVDFPVTPMLAYVRFGQWKDMLTEPAPPASDPYATGIWHYGRALAFVARRQLDRADAELAALKKTLAHDAFAGALNGSPLEANLNIASRVVAGELLARRGRLDDAVRVVEEAKSIEDGFPYAEPPLWHQPVRHVLGALLIEAGRAAEAEVAYREELTTFRENGWSLFGLAQSLEQQGRHADAEEVRERFRRAWARADVTLTSSRILSEPLASPRGNQTTGRD